MVSILVTDVVEFLIRKELLGLRHLTPCFYLVAETDISLKANKTEIPNQGFMYPVLTV